MVKGCLASCMTAARIGFLRGFMVARDAKARVISRSSGGAQGSAPGLRLGRWGDWGLSPVIRWLPLSG